MKSLFSKLSVLLLAAGFAVVGCQDFAEDIRQVEEKVEQSNNTLTQDFTVTTDGLKAEIAALEAQHAADIKAAEEAIAKLKADLEGKIAADIDAAEAALKAAYEAADNALAAQAANDKKELEGKLAEAAQKATQALETAKANLETAYKAADQKIETEYKAADVQLKADLEKQLSDLKSLLEKADATQKSELEAKIAATEKALSAATVEINKTVTALQTSLTERISKIEGEVAGIRASVDEFIANYQKNYELADTVLKQEIEKELDALEAEYTAGNADLTKKLADLEAAYKAADETLKASIAAEKQAVLDQLTAEKNALLEKIQDLKKALDAKDLELANSIAALKTNLEAADVTLQANIDAVDAALKAAEKKLQDQITANAGLIADLQDADVTLQANIDALAKTHADDKVALEQAIKAEADARVEAIKLLVQKHADDVKALQDSIDVNAAAIKAEKKAREDADVTLQDNIDAVDTALKAAKTALEEADKKLQDAIDAEAKLRSDEDKEIREDLAEETLARVADVAALKGRADALETWQAEAKLALADHESRIAQNEADIVLLEKADEALQKNIDAAIKKAEDELAAFKKEVENTYATKQELKDGLKDLETKLTGLINDVDAKVVELTTKVNDYIKATDETLAKLAQADKDLNDLIYTVKEGLEKAIKDGDEAVRAELKDAEAALKQGLTDAKNELQGKIEAEEVARKAAITALETALNTKIDGVQTQVTANANAIAALETRVKTAEDEISSLATRLGIVEGQVEDLLARVQKIVYLPEYADGKATVPYATLSDGTILQGRNFYMDFMVYPNDEELITGLVGGGAIFSFDVQDVTTRAAVPTLVNESNVKMPIYKDGKCVGIKLLVRATGLNDDFYKKPNVSGEESYSVALVLDNGNDHYSTEYINLFPEHMGDLTFDIKSAKKPTAASISGHPTDAEPEQTIPYTDTEASRTSLSGHMVYFDLGTEFKNQSYSQIEGLGFDLSEVFEAKVTYDGTGIDLFTKEEVLHKETQLNNIVVKLDPNEIKTDNVGKNINVVYNYTLGTETKKAGSVVSIAKQPLTFDLGTETATWAYELDVAADAYAFNSALTPATYNRTFAELTDDVDVAASGITLANLKGLTATSIVVKEDGTEVVSPNITITYDGAAGKEATVTYNNFAWNKTYDVTATYDLSYSTVTVKFSFNTVGRKYSPINLQIAGTTEFDLVKDINVSGAAFDYTAQIPMALQMIGVLDRSDYVAAEYIEDNFETTGQEPVMSTRKVFIKDANGEYTVEYISGTSSTGLHFVTGDYKTLKPHIYFGNFNPSKEIPTEMLYEATITTWYGQEFRILREVKINLPKYDYVHDPLWVNKAEGYYYSQVMGEYLEGITPSIKTHALSSYSADAVDMLRAFKVVDKDGNKLTAADITTAGLVPDFDIEPSYTGTKVIMSSTNVLSYNDAVNYVDVTAKLYLENSNGSRVALPTSFDVDPDGEHDGEYVEYRVLKPRPIGKLEAINHTEYILDVKKYEIPVMKYFSLMENKLNVEAEWNHSLIDAATNDWAVGTGTNGFEASKSVTDIYGLTYDWSKVEIPANIAPYVKFESATRTLTFDNTSTVGLFENVVVKIELHIAHTWGTDDAILEITFPKNVE